MFVKPLDLLSIIDNEGGEWDHPTPSWTWEGQGPANNIEEDTFRLTMAFGSNAIAEYVYDTTEEVANTSAHKSMERQLETLGAWEWGQYKVEEEEWRDFRWGRDQSWDDW